MLDLHVIVERHFQKPAWMVGVRWGGLTRVAVGFQELGYLGGDMSVAWLIMRGIMSAGSPLMMAGEGPIVVVRVAKISKHRSSALGPSLLVREL